MAIDWTPIIKKYSGLWVGILNDKTVVASGRTVQEVLVRAKKQGHKRPTLFRVPTKVLPYIGSF